jgi:hypothetical protein
MKNWFGQEAHPSDEFIHWRDDRRPFSGFYWSKSKTFDEYVSEVRAAHEKIYRESSSMAKAFELLLHARLHVAILDEADAIAEEGL